MGYNCKTCNETKFKTVDQFVKHEGVCQSCSGVRFIYHLYPKNRSFIHGELQEIQVVATHAAEAFRTAGITKHKNAYQYNRGKFYKANAPKILKVVKYNDPNYQVFKAEGLQELLEDMGVGIQVNKKGQIECFSTEKANNGSASYPLVDLQEPTIENLFIQQSFGKVILPEELKNL